MSGGSISGYRLIQAAENREAGMHLYASANSVGYGYTVRDMWDWQRRLPHAGPAIDTTGSDLAEKNW